MSHSSYHAAPGRASRSPRIGRLTAILACLMGTLAAAAPATAQTPLHRTPPPRAVRRDLPIPPSIARAIAAGTRDSTGSPGPKYWQQSVDYAIEATLDPESAILSGNETITLHNTSPDTLNLLVLRLYQNYFRPESQRNDYVTDTTDGVRVEQLTVDGVAIDLADENAYEVDGTIANLRPPHPIAPAADAKLTVRWSFEVPAVKRGERGERMGRWGHELFQIAQWYPQVAMYDDLRGWDRDPYLGTGEFYNQFGAFDVRITVPAGWLIGATGTLANPDQVLTAPVRERLALAMNVDTTVHVVAAADRGAGKATAAGSQLTWHFTADRVNDFAFMASRDAVWDATHAMTPDPTLVQVLYEPEHAGYAKSAQIGKFALEHHAKWVMRYAFPQGTIVDGPETGMEYPMIIFSGPGFGVITHEFGHEWFPMTVGSDETRYGWQDEGFNEFIDAAAGEDWSGADRDRQPADPLRIGAGYRRVAGSILEPPMMWPSDWAGPLYGVQAYTKAPLALRALGGVAGDSAVHSAFAAYAQAWRFRHPSPWDFFLFMDSALGQDLDWFWNAWWFTTETFDQRIASVDVSGGGASITVADDGDMAMPVLLRLEYADGTSGTIRRPASVWFDGGRSITISQPLGGKTLKRAVLDPENRFQDVDRSDNTAEVSGEE